MNITSITPYKAQVSGPDMHGTVSAPFVPFAVRSPKFLELSDGTILYFYQAKIGSASDEALHSIVLMRSHDGGKTWGDMRLLQYEQEPFSEICCFVPIYDALHDTVIFFRNSRHWKPGCEQDRLINEEDQIVHNTVYERFWITKSTDGGLSWSDYKEVFVEGTPSHWTEDHILTPDIGIQLRHQKDTSKNGRLIVPSYHCGLYENGRRAFGAHLLVSDDLGDTWRVTAIQENIGSNEGLMVEREDGSLLLNCRNMGGIPWNRRTQGISYDGGETLVENRIVDTLYDPCCHAGFAHAVADGKEYLFFTAPSGPAETPYFWDGGIDGMWGRREGLALFISADNGNTYRLARQITGKGELAAYSALCATSKGKLLCAWESGPEEQLYQDIKYTVFDIAELIKSCF